MQEFTRKSCSPPSIAARCVFAAALTLVWLSSCAAETECAVSQGLPILRFVNSLAGGSHCNAFLMKADERVIVVTAGHCVLDIGVADPRPRNDLATLAFEFIRSEDSGVLTTTRLSTSHLLAARIEPYDVALFDVTEDFAKVGCASGLAPLEMATEVPAAGALAYLHNGDDASTLCETMIDGTYELREGDYSFRQTLGFRCEESIPRMGDSGSLLSDSTGRVIGVLSTMAWPVSEASCALNHPCELDENGARVSVPGRAYAANLMAVRQCFQDLSTIAVCLEHAANES